MLHLVQADVELLVLLGGHGLDDVHQIGEQGLQGGVAVIQDHLAALDFGHVQNVVDKPHQQLAGQADVPQVFPHALRLVHVLLRQLGHAGDGVHGRADVVGHVGEEAALGAVGALRRFAGLLLRLEHPAGQVPVDQEHRRQDQQADQRQHHQNLRVLDDTVGLLHNHPVGYDGHHVPSPGPLHRHVAEDVVLLLVVEAGHTLLPVLQRLAEGGHQLLIVTLQIDDVEEVLEGAVAVAVLGAD